MLLYEGDASLQFAAPTGVTVVDEIDWAEITAVMPQPPGSRTFVAAFSNGAVSVLEHPSRVP
jgi:hypothetical protein